MFSRSARSISKIILFSVMGFFGGASQAQPVDPAAIALKATHGACDISRDPHSLACNEWTFTNNPVFPLFPNIDWMGRLQGDWFAVTYVSAAPEHDEFLMARNPRRPTQPMGVLNRDDHSLLGHVRIAGRAMIFENWRGHRISTDPSSFKFSPDGFTVTFNMRTGSTPHAFACRDFNRNDKHHLLCAWWVQRGDGSLFFKGYFGFLSMSDWNDFLRNGKR